MQLKVVRLVITPEWIAWLKTNGNKVNFDKTTSKAAYIKTEMYGATLGKGYRASYRYTVYFFRSKLELLQHQSQAPTVAKRIVTKHLNVPVDPGPENGSRFRDGNGSKDFIVSSKFKANKRYTGYWIEVDMNSAEPYYVSQLFPSMLPAINYRYDDRKKNPLNKLVLVSINGNLRNLHYPSYQEVCERLYDKMVWLWDTLEKYGAICFAMRRDSVIAYVPEDFIIPEEIHIGNKLGQFKVKRDYGTIIPYQGNFVYSTDMEILKSKKSGVMGKSLLDQVNVVCSRILNIGLEVKDNVKN